VARGLERGQLPRAADLRRWARAALAAADRTGVVSLRLMGADEMRALNAQFRNKDRPTNVLSFPADGSDAPGETLLGDVAVCVPVVVQEAAEQGKPLAAHYAHLIVHGVLHLLGYDHELEEDAVQMEAREVRVLAGLGFADPYRVAGAAASA